MGFEICVSMVASAPSLPHAITAVLSRLDTIDVRLTGRFYETGEEQQEVALEPGWDAKVNAWPGVAFSVARTGPEIDVIVKKVKRCHPAGHRLKNPVAWPSFDATRLSPSRAASSL